MPPALAEPLPPAWMRLVIVVSFVIGTGFGWLFAHLPADDAMRAWLQHRSHLHCQAV